MSSILDALRKLESERSVEVIPERIDIAEALSRRDFAAGATAERSVTIRLTPVTLALAMMLLTILLAVVVVAALWLLRQPGAEYSMTARADSGGEPSQVANLAAGAAFWEEAAQPLVSAPGSVESKLNAALVPDERIQDTAETTSESKSRFLVDRPITALEVTAPRTNPVREPASSSAPSASSSPRSAQRQSTPGIPLSSANIRALPELTQGMQRQLGVEITIQVITEESMRRNPPTALVNLSRVSVGDLIPGTNATLIGVDLQRIAVELNGTRYRVDKW